MMSDGDARARPVGIPTWPHRVGPGLRTTIAAHTGRLAGRISRRLHVGEGAVIPGRVALALDPQALGRLAGGRRGVLAAGRRVVLVSATNGKTTPAHMLAAALRPRGPVAHNATGANMPDGAVAAL